MSFDLAEFVIKNVSPVDYYKSLFPNWSGDINENVLCVFHKNVNSPSLSVGLSGGGAYCHSCEKKIGSIIHFEKERHVATLDDEQASLEIYKQFIHPILAVDQADIDLILEEYENALFKNKKVYQTVQKDLGIDAQHILQFRLGWRQEKVRLTIPIFNEFGHLINIRYYQLPSHREPESKYPKIYNEKNYGKPATLYPLPPLLTLLKTQFRPSVLYFMAGERDSLLAWSLGIPNLTSTTGEHVWHPLWTQTIKNFRLPIAIVGDTDETGKKAAKTKLELLTNEGIEAVIVNIPPTYKDFSKWVMEGKGTAIQLRELTPSLGLQGKRRDNEEDGYEDGNDNEKQQRNKFPKVNDPSNSIHDGEFTVADIGRRPDLLNSVIKLKALVSAKIDRTFSIPNVFQVGNRLYALPVSRELLAMVKMSDTDIIKYIRDLLNTKSTPLPVAHITVTEVEIIPMVVPGLDSFYVNQRCFYFGDKIESNLPYLMSIVPTSEMKTQETVGLILDIYPVSNVLDEFTFDYDTRQRLAKQFKVEGDPYRGLAILAEEISTRHSLIYNRGDLHMVALLTWLSPLQFDFFRDGTQRGWMNALVVGDTQTGKSEVAKALRNLFNCGVFISAENCTYVGLIGGAVKSGTGVFMLRWGKIPLYNRQLVVIEELSGISTEQISHMSEVRSAGIARLDKGGLSGEVAARTRLICLSNVREQYGSLASANSGVRAVQELIGHNEDISRFDLILTLTDDEVPNEIINQDRSQPDQQHNPYSAEEFNLFRTLIIFVWSLKPEQIEITRDAYVTCLNQTLMLSKEYHPNVPIFKGGSGRLKLARIACAIACIQFNWNEDKQKLVVEKRHVLAAVTLLRQLYDKPSLGYKRYSRQQFFLESLQGEENMLAAIQKILKEDRMTSFLRFLSHAHFFQSRELGEVLNLPSFMTDRLISALYSANAIRKARAVTGWELTIPGRRWVEKNHDVTKILAENI